MWRLVRKLKKQEEESMEHGEVKVKSLRKALDILNYFTEKPLLGVTEISEYLV